MTIVLFLLLLAVAVIAWLANRILPRRFRNARWLQLFVAATFPVALLVMVFKQSSAFVWYSLPPITYSPWLNWVLVALYVLLVVFRNVLALSSAVRENRILMADSRLPPKAFEEWLRNSGVVEIAFLAGFRKLPDIRLHPWIHQPLNVGRVGFASWKSCILLPAAAIPGRLLDEDPYFSTASLDPLDLNELTEDALYDAILHELGHLQRKDTLTGFLLFLGNLFLPQSWHPNVSVKEKDEFGLGGGASWYRGFTNLVGAPGKAFRAFQMAYLEEVERRASEFPTAAHTSGPKHIGSSLRRATETVCAVGGIAGVILGLALVGPNHDVWRLALGGHGFILGALPSGWEIQWITSSKDNRGAVWGYRPAMAEEPSPLVYLSTAKPETRMLLASNVILDIGLSGISRAEFVWEFEHVSSSPGNLDEGLILFGRLGDFQGPAGTMLSTPPQPIKVEQMERIGHRRYRVSRSYEVHQGFQPNRIFCEVVVRKPAVYFFRPPKITLFDAQGKEVPFPKI